MKILELPEFENIERMARKEIVTLLSPLTESAPDEASKLRLNLALRSGRTVKSLIKMLGRVDYCSKYTDSKYDDTEIGDRIAYVDTRSSGRGCFTMSRKEGMVWAIKGSNALVTCGANLKRVSLEKESE